MASTVCGIGQKCRYQEQARKTGSFKELKILAKDVFFDNQRKKQTCQGRFRIY
jgi:hypothetical protein